MNEVSADEVCADEKEVDVRDTKILRFLLTVKTGSSCSWCKKSLS